MTMIPPEPLAPTRVEGLHRLSDESFALIVVQTAFRNARKPPQQSDTWQHLLSPGGLIERTQRCLITVANTHTEAALQRDRERPIDPPHARRRDQEHSAVISRALGEVRKKLAPTTGAIRSWLGE